MLLLFVEPILLTVLYVELSERFMEGSIVELSMVELLVELSLVWVLLLAIIYNCFETKEFIVG